jgi:hypothetical protein
MFQQDITGNIFTGYNVLLTKACHENQTLIGAPSIRDNPDLTKAQIDELQKALPKCKIQSNPTK